MNPNTVFTEGEVLIIGSCEFVVRHIGKKDSIMILEEISDLKKEDKKEHKKIKGSVLHFLSLIFLLIPSVASASSYEAIFGWESVLRQIASSLQGPVATSISVIALVGAAISLMFFETNKGLRWFVVIVIGFSIVSSAYGLMGLFGLSSVLM